MVHLYEKTCISKDKSKGLIETMGENPLEKGPCIIVIPNMTMSLRILNLYLNTVAKLIDLPAKSSADINWRIFGLGYGLYSSGLDIFLTFEPTEADIDEFVEKYILPLLIENGKRVDIETAMKRIRKATFLTYCDGAIHFLRIEAAIKKKLADYQMYTKSEVKLILSQVCLAAITGGLLMEEETSTLAITFGDINDPSFEYDSKTYDDILRMRSGYISYKESSLGYAVVDKGSHDFEHVMLENHTLSAKIKTFLETSLANAQENMDSDTINPITYEKMDKALANATEQQAHHL